MSNSRVLKEKPAASVLVQETYSPTLATDYTVQDGDSWVGLARKVGLVDPWDLIDFNFPGTKEVHAKNAQLASRQVNWYLAEYVGCEKSTDSYNLAFSSRLTRGRGVHKGGKIFLPVAGPLKVPTLTCGTIDIPEESKSPMLAAVLQQLGARMPTRARCLDPLELAIAKPIYQNSLVYDDIFISDGFGGGGNPFTIALELGGRWIVILNVGPGAYADPAYSKKSVLIHELAHAWQSQHHPKPWQFMLNCTECNAAAAVATRVDAASRNKWVKTATGMPDIGTGEASSYAYVPGLPFGEYAGEQIAEQVEDFFYPPRGLETSKRVLLSSIWSHITSVQAGIPDWGNIESLGNVRFEYHTQGVVWHDGY
jgi:hypothetical protein